MQNDTAGDAAAAAADARESPCPEKRRFVFCLPARRGAALVSPRVHEGKELRSQLSRQFVQNHRTDERLPGGRAR